MIRPTPCAPRPARLRPLALALLTATSLTGCEFTQSLFRGRSSIPEAPVHPQFVAPLVKPPSIVAAQPPAGVAVAVPAPVLNAPVLNAPPLGAELLRTPAGRHIAVLPIEGAPQDRGFIIREALASALGVRIDQNAFSVAPQSFRLECRAFLEGGAVLLEWRLMDSIGRTLDVVFERQTFTTRPGLDPWSAVSDEALSALGRRSAERLAREMAASNLVVAPRGAVGLGPAPVVAAPPAVAAAPVTASGLAFGGGGGVEPSGISFAPMAPQPPRGAAPAPIPAPAPMPAPAPVVQTAPQPSFSLTPPPPPRGAPAPVPVAAPAPPPPPPPAPAPTYDPPPAAAPAPAPAPAPAGPFGAATNTASTAATAPIAFRGVFGAPGDGDRSLSAALRQLLLQSGERVVPTGTPGAMILAGQVEKKSGSSGDVISITWRLEDPFGGGVGQVLQENEVPRGALDGAWGEDAGYAAEGALDGVRQLIAAARKGPG